MVARKCVSLIIHSYVFAHEEVFRKDWGTRRSSKTYNLCPECPPLTHAFLKINWSQRDHTSEEAKLL